VLFIVPLIVVINGKLILVKPAQLIAFTTIISNTFGKSKLVNELQLVNVTISIPLSAGATTDKRPVIDVNTKLFNLIATGKFNITSENKLSNVIVPSTSIKDGNNKLTNAGARIIDIALDWFSNTPVENVVITLLSLISITAREK
jgi:hypothetical protein